jgi:integration host factor subunit beta
MTKSDLIEAVVGNSTLSARHAKIIVDTFLETLAKALSQEKHVELRGFGTFGIRRRRPRLGRNPRTGKRVSVPAKRIPYFKPGRILKARLNSPTKESGEKKKD